VLTAASCSTALCSLLLLLLQVRSFMELSDMLLDFDLPESTKQAWENII
jgi:hypothetical protein